MDKATDDPTAGSLRFGYGETNVGLMLVAESNLGVAAIFLGDDRDALRGDLQRAFPGRSLLADERALGDTIANAVLLTSQPHLATSFPLDITGTPLEVAVWKALQEIPVGETRSYGDIARTLAVPATAQEVGAACAANRIAIAIPCHRVVKADGSISGYRWGVSRKLRLINMEGVA